MCLVVAYITYRMMHVMCMHHMNRAKVPYRDAVEKCVVILDNCAVTDKEDVHNLMSNVDYEILHQDFNNY